MQKRHAGHPVEDCHQLAPLSDDLLYTDYLFG
jgi:hypothetical protein